MWYHVRMPSSPQWLKDNADRVKQQKREWYHRNSAQVKATTIKNKALYRKRNKEYVNAIKAEACLDCGGQFHPEVMEFDHLGDKVACVSYLVNTGASIELIDKEISKCECVCANCHRVRTHSRRTQ